MKINTTVKIIMDESNVKAALADWINIRHGYTAKPEDVELSVGTRCEGFGMAEHYVTCFKECAITIKENK